MENEEWRVYAPAGAWFGSELAKNWYAAHPAREVENGEETEFILCPSCVTGGACNLCLGDVF